MIVNSILIAVIIWKIWPLFTDFQTIIDYPAAILYLRGGFEAAAAGSGAALIVSAILIIRRKEGRIRLAKIFLLDLLALAAAAVICLGVAYAGIAASETLSGGRQESRRTIEEGDVAPMIELSDLSGRKYRLADYKGRTVVLNFWASWCPPCRAELPELAEFHDTVNPADTALVSINLYSSERSPGQLPAFIEKHGIDYPVLLDKEGLAAAAFGINTIPTTFIIDPDGRIKNRVTGALTSAWLLKEL